MISVALCNEMLFSVLLLVIILPQNSCLVAIGVEVGIRIWLDSLLWAHFMQVNMPKKLLHDF